ncbi:MAG: 3-deoxy-D-manno-octulosonic acid transferase [Tannerellaceae bacterium]|nr:3-deoxy-D-manno-octulosonic acid transferase [Tannerellaceae bacterium]
MLYSLIIHLYAFTIELLSPFHKKARMMRFGQWKTNGILREHIDRDAHYIWFHASSLGEFEQGRPMMETIKTLYPHHKILLTFFSPSGYEVRKDYSGADVICYLPFDTLFKVRKFIGLANPSMAIFIKYEFWANYLGELKRRGIPVFSISSVFRRNQLFFKWYGRFYLRTLGCFDRLFVQDAASAELLARYGISKVSVSGDTRFDRVVDVRRNARPIPLVEAFARGGEGEGRLTLIAGSSWPRDEEIVIGYFNEHPGVRLIIAPHEINREHLLEIHSRLRRPSISLSEATDEDDITGKDCLIIDSFGLLSSIYRYCDIAYIGGGFGRGIHNVLEAAVYGIPVIFGPAHLKFREAVDIIAHGGGFAVTDSKTFDTLLDRMTADSDLLTTAGAAAGDFVHSRTGATSKILDALKDTLTHIP